MNSLLNVELFSYCYNSTHLSIFLKKLWFLNPSRWHSLSLKNVYRQDFLIKNSWFFNPSHWQCLFLYKMCHKKTFFLTIMIFYFLKVMICIFYNFDYIAFEQHDVNQWAWSIACCQEPLNNSLCIDNEPVHIFLWNWTCSRESTQRCV